MTGMLGGSSASALAPVHIPTPIASVLFNTVPLVVMLYGFWDEYSDYLQSQTLQSYNGNVEEFDFIIGEPNWIKLKTCIKKVKTIYYWF